MLENLNQLNSTLEVITGQTNEMLRLFNSNSIVVSTEREQKLTHAPETERPVVPETIPPIPRNYEPFVRYNL